MDAEAVAALCREVMDLGGVVRVRGGKPTLMRTRRGWEREKLVRLMPLLRDDLPAVLEFFRASTPTTDDPPPAAEDAGGPDPPPEPDGSECDECGAVVFGEFPAAVWGVVCGRIDCPHWRPGMGPGWYADYRNRVVWKRKQGGGRG